MGTYTVIFKNACNQPVQNVQAWIANTEDITDNIPLFADSNGTATCGAILECGTTCVPWPYLGFTTGFDGSATFCPSFGGHGSLEIQQEVPCSCGGGYRGYKIVEARSTDFNADGNTDQQDKLELGRAIKNGTTQSYHDLNVDGARNAADYLIVVAEMATELNGGTSPTPRFTCVDECFPNPPCQVQAVHNENHWTADQSAPGSTTLSASEATYCNVSLTWTSPGDDTDNGSQIGVAKEFDIRASANPITEANFSSATPLTGEPAPGLPGTQHTMVASTKAPYYAIRTIDWAGNVSPVSSATTAMPTASDLGITQYTTSPRSVTLSWSSIPCALSYCIRKRSGAPITDANWATSTIVDCSIPGSQTSKYVTDLPGNSYWYFALKATDNVDSTSPVSNNTCIRFSPFALCDGKPELPPAETAPARDLAITAVRTSKGGADVAFTLATGSQATLEVFDVAGRKVEVQDLAHFGPGDGSVQIGAKLAPGVYWVKIRQGDRTASHSAIIIH